MEPTRPPSSRTSRTTSRTTTSRAHRPPVRPTPTSPRTCARPTAAAAADGRLAAPTRPRRPTRRTARAARPRAARLRPPTPRFRRPTPRLTRATPRSPPARTRRQLRPRSWQQRPSPEGCRPALLGRRWLDRRPLGRTWHRPSGPVNVDRPLRHPPSPRRRRRHRGGGADAPGVAAQVAGPAGVTGGAASSAPAGRWAGLPRAAARGRNGGDPRVERASRLAATGLRGLPPARSNRDGRPLNRHHAGRCRPGLGARSGGFRRVGDDGDRWTEHRRTNGFGGSVSAAAAATADRAGLRPAPRCRRAGVAGQLRRQPAVPARVARTACTS